MTLNRVTTGLAIPASGWQVRQVHGRWFLGLGPWIEAASALYLQFLQGEIDGEVYRNRDLELRQRFSTG